MWKDLRFNVSLIYFMKNNKKMYRTLKASGFCLENACLSSIIKVNQLYNYSY
ncbi:hypothetical protein EZS27_024111 [termite gut metagenome]|uniref:Uncharacterized protein n=1 Tax=termite gut metagenome TaxID=433724 RepID=A0A5J4R1I4_9ZZZZ